MCVKVKRCLKVVHRQVMRRSRLPWGNTADIYDPFHNNSYFDALTSAIGFQSSIWKNVPRPWEL